MDNSLANDSPSLRFYPDSLPSFANEPTRDRFHIGFEDDSIGEGVRSLVAFSPGDLVASFTGFLTSEVTQFTLQIKKSQHLHDPYFYGKILHSCEPNTRIDVAKRSFIALKAIVPGDFVTIDYAHTEDYLFKNFPCACGAPSCRKTVLGRRQLITPEVTEQVARIRAGRRNVVPLTARVTPTMAMFEVINEPTRRAILALLVEKNLRSQDFSQLLTVNYSAISYHLRVMRQLGLVTQYRQGRTIFYALDRQIAQDMLEQGRSHFEDWMKQLLTAPNPSKNAGRFLSQTRAR